MKLVFSFDDGRDDAAKAADVLNKFRLKGSFHVTTGFVDGTFKTDAFGVGRKPLTIKQIQTMYDDGMDISLHGDKHITEIDDFKVSYEKMNKWIHKKGKIGMSIPNSQFSDEELSDFCNKLNSKLLYARVGRNPKCYSLLGKICYVLYRVFHFQFLYNYFNKFNLISDFNKFKIYSLVVTADTRINNLKKFIEKYYKSDYTLVLMFHSIVDKKNNKWEFSNSDFINLCEFVSKNNISVYTLEELSNEQ